MHICRPRQRETCKSSLRVPHMMTKHRSSAGVFYEIARCADFGRLHPSSDLHGSPLLITLLGHSRRLLIGVGGQNLWYGSCLGGRRPCIERLLMLSTGAPHHHPSCHNRHQSPRKSLCGSIQTSLSIPAICPTGCEGWWSWRRQQLCLLWSYPGRSVQDPKC